MSRAAGHLRRGTTGEAKIIHRTHYQTEVWRRKQNQTYLLFILPAFAFFFTFFLLPFAQSLVLAFTDAYGYNKHFHFIGLANFKEALSNRAFLRAIWVTVRYTLFVTLGANVSALVLALLLDSNTHFKKLFRAVFFLPNLMSLIIVGFVWVFLYGNVYRSAVQAFGIPEAYQISWLGSMKLAVYSIGLTAIWQCAGYYMIIYIAGLQNISKDLLEAAAVDGANKWTVITRIKLPLLAPVVVMNVILCLASCFKAFDIPMAMTSGGPAGATTTIALQIYNTGFSSNRTGYATAQSIILFLIISAIQRQFICSKAERTRQMRKARAGKGGYAITILVGVIAVLYFFPVLIAIVNSFKTKGEILTSAISFPSRPTFENYKTIIETADFPKALLNSCILTAGVVVLNLIVSSLAGYALAKWKSRWSACFMLLFLSSMFVPFHTIMISLLSTARDLHVTGHIWGLILIYCGLQCPIPIFLIRGFVSSVPGELEEAALLDGCGVLKRFVLIVLPLIKPILTTVAILNVLWVWNDFLLPYLILGKPITIPLSQMYFYGQYNQQWHLIMAGFVVTTIPVILFYIFMQKNIVNGIAAGAIKG